MISIKFLPVITLLYKTKNGRYQVSITVPSALKVTLYRTCWNNRTWRIISIVAENKSHAHHKTHFAYNESHHDSYPQFPPSLLGMPGTMADHLGKTNKGLALLKH